jgi:hypothetical protein
MAEWKALCSTLRVLGSYPAGSPLRGQEDI